MMARFPAARALVIAALAAAAPPAAAAILFQQTVTPVDGIASFDRDWFSTAPGTTWIGIDTGRLATAEALIGADYFGLFWDYGPDGPELFEENYFTRLQCQNAVGDGACAVGIFGNTRLATRMTGAVYEIDWTGFQAFNACEPFRGVYFVRCAAYGFQTTDNDYRLRATASAPVTFTIYDADPTNGTIPEPASWALLIAGFGLIGAALRRRRAGVQPG